MLYRSLPNYEDFCFWEPQRYEKVSLFEKSAKQFCESHMSVHLSTDFIFAFPDVQLLRVTDSGGPVTRDGQAIKVLRAVIEHLVPHSVPCSEPP